MAVHERIIEWQKENPEKYLKMLDEWGSLKKEAQKIKTIPKGEVVLFTGSERFYTHAKLGECDGGEHFIACLGIFSGICGYTWGVPDVHLGLDEKVCGSIKNHQGFELKLVDQRGILVPRIEMKICVELGLSYGDRVYVGPKQISQVLEEKGQGHFDRFLKQYAEKYRKV